MILTLLRRFRSPLIALVAIVFSVTIALASQPTGKATGHENAAAHGGKSVSAQASDELTEADESAEPDASDATETKTDEAGDQGNDCNVDLTGDLSSFSHGQIVCTAAHMPTPSGYANHGAWVSHWAKHDHGSDASTPDESAEPGD